MTTHVPTRLSVLVLDTPLADPLDRSVMPMSTVIASPMWMIEAGWDGNTLGDPQVFKNRACGANGAMMLDAVSLPLPNDWIWWGGVPCARVKSYKFLDADKIQPQSHDLPFKTSHGERKAKSGEPSKVGA